MQDWPLVLDYKIDESKHEVKLGDGESIRNNESYELEYEDHEQYSPRKEGMDKWINPF